MDTIAGANTVMEINDLIQLKKSNQLHNALMIIIIICIQVEGNLSLVRNQRNKSSETKEVAYIPSGHLIHD